MEVALPDDASAMTKSTVKETLCNGNGLATSESDSNDAVVPSTELKSNGKKTSLNGPVNGLHDSDESRESMDSKDEEPMEVEEDSKEGERDDGEKDDDKENVSERGDQDKDEEKGGDDDVEGKANAADEDEIKDPKDKEDDDVVLVTEKTPTEKTPEKQTSATDATKSAEKKAQSIDLTSDSVRAAPKETEKKKVTPSTPSKLSSVLKSPASTVQIRPMATILHDVGMDLARQQVYKDLIRIQTKKQGLNKLDEKESRQLGKLKEAYDDLVSKNETYVKDSFECSECPFKTDVHSVLENHREYGHGQHNVKNPIKCAMCDAEFRGISLFIHHMENVHKRKGRQLVHQAFFSCPFCPFENNAKNSYNKHIMKCEKLFKLYRNLEPTPADCDIPIKLPKATAAPLAPKAGPNKSVSVQQQLARARQTNIAAAAALAARNVKQRAPPPVVRPQLAAPSSVNSGSQMVQVGNQWYSMIHVNGQRFLTPFVAGQNVAPVVLAQNAAPAAPPKPAAPPPKATSLTPSKSQSSLLRKKAQSKQPQPPSGNFEVCEICGGFVKDRESLRIHFYWAHKIDMHKEVFSAKTPNLHCDYCTFRCWTVQGLSRHRNMSHKDLINNKDKTRPPFYCTMCRPTPELLHPETFWLHMAAHHGVTVDNIFEKMHCVVCGVANIKVPRALETHMLNLHGHLFTSDLLSLARKIPKTKAMSSVLALTSREQQLIAIKERKKSEKDPCPLCKRMIPNGRPWVRHMKSEHLKQCSVVVQRLSKELFDKHIDTYIEKYGPLKTSASAKASRKRSSPSEVIVLDDSPAKKRPRLRSPSRDDASTPSSSTPSSSRPASRANTKEVIEVDGEEIVVEVQQDHDDGEDSDEDVVEIKEKNDGDKGPEEKDQNDIEENADRDMDTNDGKARDDKDEDEGNSEKEDEKSHGQEDEESMDTKDSGDS